MQLLHLEPVDGAAQLVDLDRAGVDLHAQTGRSLVDEVDGLVRQLPTGDVAVGQRGGSHEGGVLDLDLVVRLVALLEPAQDRDGVLDRGLADEDLLEATLERRVLLDVLAELVERGGSDEPQLSSGEHRLEHVAGIHRGLAGRARPDDGVELVDEGDDLAVAGLDLLEDRLEPLLELAAVLRAGDHRAEVEADEPLATQGLGDVAVDDALSQALDDRGLADPGLADEDRVVLCPAREHLHDAPDLGVTADDRVELAVTSLGREVGAVLLEGLAAALLGFGRHLAARTQLVDARLDRLGDARPCHSWDGALLDEGQHEQVRRRGGCRPWRT